MLKNKLLYILFFIIVFIFIILPNILQSLFNNQQYNGKITITNRKYQNIEIKRDLNFGIPNIISKDLKSTLYGLEQQLGWVHAQERLWQMHFKRFLAMGKLQELFGKDPLLRKIDIFFRTLGIERISKQNLQNQPKFLLENFQAYADGVNDYVFSQMKIFPLEFYITNSIITWTNWTILDSFSIAKFMFANLNIDFAIEIFMSLWEETYGSQDIEEVFPVKKQFVAFDFYDVYIVNDDELKQQNLFSQYQDNQKCRPKDSKKDNDQRYQAIKYAAKNVYQILDQLIGSFENSNSFVIAGQHTESGYPILANDPHLHNNIPSIWFQAQLIYGQNYQNFINGVSMAGLPYIMIGRTNYLSWGCTTLLSADTSDSFLETLNQDYSKYLFDNKWIDIIKYNETIRSRNSKKYDEEIIEIKETRHGPILSQIFSEFINQPIDLNKAISHGWAGHMVNDNSFAVIYQLYEDKYFEKQKFLKKIGSINGISQNMIFATIDKNIAYFGVGGFPYKNNFELSYSIKDGSDADNDWQNLIPYNEKVYSINPAKGYIVTANNKHSTPNDLHHTALRSYITLRAYRIDKLIKQQIKSGNIQLYYKLQKQIQGKKFTINDVKSIQLDTVDSAAEKIVPIIINISMKLLFKFQIAKEQKKIKRMIEGLKNWDFKMNIQSQGAAIWQVWELFFQQKLFPDIENKEIALIYQFGILNEQYYLKLFEKWENITLDILNNEQKKNRYCDYQKIYEKFGEESQNYHCAFNIPLSLLEAYGYLKKYLGIDYTQWNYGEIHKQYFEHIPLSKAPFPINLIFERFINGAGNTRTSNCAQYDIKKLNLRGVHSSNYRQILDMSPNGKGYYSLEMGESENIFNKHYDDQMERHQNGEYLEMLLGIEDMNKLQNYDQFIINFE